MDIDRPSLRVSSVDAGGVRTHWLEAGEGRPVVLLHGSQAAMDAELTWFRTMALLAPRHRVMAFDQIGFGGTDMPPDGRYQNRLERCAHAVATLDAQSVGPSILVGHSEGGFMASRIAIDRPDLVSGLVIVTSGGTAPRLGGRADEAWMAASEDAYDHVAQTRDEDTFIATHGYLMRRSDAEYEQRLRRNYRQARQRGNIAMFLDLPAEETDNNLYIKLQETHLLPRLGEISVPVLLVWAGDDPTVPVERGAALMRLFGRADMHVFHGSGHMVMHERAEDFAALLDWWISRKVTDR